MNLWKSAIVVAVVAFVGVFLSVEVASLYLSSDMVPSVAGAVGGALAALGGILMRRLRDRA